jgi:hypothetical protein
METYDQAVYQIAAKRVLCFAKILYALKIARFSVATDVPSGLSLHPPSAKILSRGNPRAVYLYI